MQSDVALPVNTIGVTRVDVSMTGKNGPVTAAGAIRLGAGAGAAIGRAALWKLTQVGVGSGSFPYIAQAGRRLNVNSARAIILDRFMSDARRIGLLPSV